MYLLLKGTKHQLSVYDKTPTVRRFFSCLSYSSVQMVYCYRSMQKKTTNRLNTIATQINIVNYWPHCDVILVPNTHADIGMPRL